jgi:hypothetical protein
MDESYRSVAEFDDILGTRTIVSAYSTIWATPPEAHSLDETILP